MPNITVPQELPDSASSWWFYMFNYTGDRERLSAKLAENNIGHTIGYIEPAYDWPVFRDKSFFPGGIWPAEVVAGKNICITQRTVRKPKSSSTLPCA